MTLQVYKLDPEVNLPRYATQKSACFDIEAWIPKDSTLSARNPHNEKTFLKASPDRAITLLYGWRVLIPTGLIFDLYGAQSVRLHPRSGLALKNGIMLANCEAVIDPDYRNETFVMLLNTSWQPFTVTNGDRICQGEVVYSNQQLIRETTVLSDPNSDREGGLGSTGV